MQLPDENIGSRKPASSELKDSWKGAEAYEYYMGRWSRLAARVFIDRLVAPRGLNWLDVGCGSGALCEAILNARHPDQLLAVDQSESFVKETHERFGGRVQCRVGDALSLPVPDHAVHFAVSGLVLNYVPEPEKALAEMKRVTVPGGTIATYVWNYGELMEFVIRFWDAAVTVDANASELHQGRRFGQWNAEHMITLFERAGLRDIESYPVEIATHFRDFDDYWLPFLGGQGPAPTYLMAQDESTRLKIRERLLNTLPFQTDGSLILRSRAWAVRGSA